MIRRLKLSNRVFFEDSDRIFSDKRSIFKYVRILSDILYPSLKKGDVLIRPVKNSKINQTGRYALSVYDGMKLRHLFKWQFGKIFSSGFYGDGHKISEIESMGEALIQYEGREVVYKSGYRLVLSECYRCGWCCIIPSVVVVRPDCIENGPERRESNLVKPPLVPCRHLSWSEDGKAICKVHHYDWFYNTPCYEHKSELRPTKCKPPAMTKNSDWHLRLDKYLAFG